MQKFLTVTAIATFVGGVVAAILFGAGVAKTQVAPIAFVLGSIAFTAGVPAFIERISKWGVPGDDD